MCLLLAVSQSTLLSTLTNTHSEQAAYEFTTLTCIPGVISYKDARIQLLDLPGIIEGAAKGKGRGRQVIGVARTSDLVIMMLDAGKAEIQKELLRMELDAVGIRINQKPPNITIRHKKTGGVSVTSMIGDLTHIDVHQARNILHLYKVSCRAANCCTQGQRSALESPFGLFSASHAHTCLHPQRRSEPPATVEATDHRLTRV